MSTVQVERDIVWKTPGTVPDSARLVRTGGFLYSRCDIVVVTVNIYGVSKATIR